MSEYWKSTPKYWCKHCSIFVRDTKIERQNHEATGKHQGALKRFLRDLHRGHEQEERDKDRARREIERLKGVASSSSSSPASTSSAAPTGSTATEAARKRQMEQLAEMGVSIPTAFRGDMAMPGEWTVTATKVVEKDASGVEKPAEAKAVGVRRKREQTEEEKEEEKALQDLGSFKKPKKWGTTKSMPQDDKDLDALLEGSLFPAVKKEETPVKVEGVETVKDEAAVKVESGAEAEGKSDLPVVKGEPADEAGKIDAPALGEAEGPTEAAAPAVVFKKRKPKGIRQK